MDELTVSVERITFYGSSGFSGKKSYREGATPALAGGARESAKRLENFAHFVASRFKSR